MRYVPDIIPAEHKIRPDYFKGGAPVTIAENALNKVFFVLGFILGGFMMLGGLGLLLSGDKLAGALLWLSGFIVFPLGFDIIQRKLSAQIPGWLRFVFVVLLLFFATALVSK